MRVANVRHAAASRISPAGAAKSVSGRNFLCIAMLFKMGYLLYQFSMACREEFDRLNAQQF
jgi:hypothetical protein